MRTNKQKQVVGYVRTATVSQKDEGNSVEVQEQKIREYCSKKSYSLSKVFSDNGIGGNTLQRPALEELLAETAKGNISKVICFDTSRLSRDTKDYLMIKSVLKQNGVEIETVTGQVLSDAPNSKFLDEMLATINSFSSQVGRAKHQYEHVSVNKQNRFKRLVKISVSEKDLNNMSKFHELLEEDPFCVTTCGLCRSQIVLIAKILRLNLENDTEVKAEFRF